MLRLVFTVLTLLLFQFPLTLSSEFTDSKSEILKDDTSGYKNYASTDTHSSEIPPSTIPEGDYSGSIPKGLTAFEITKEYTPISQKYGIELSTSVPSSHFTSVRNQCEKNNHAESCYFLGLFYLYGLSGLSVSPLSALHNFRKAGRSGHTDSQCAAGILLYYGAEGVQRDSRGSVKYFRLAMEGGNEYGTWLLGRAYYEGRVEGRIDFFEAARLFGLSGVKEAVLHLGLMFEYGLIPSEANEGEEWDGYSSPHKPDYSKAKEMYSEAWEQGVDDAGYYLGLMWAYGRGVEQDFTRAMEIFRQLGEAINELGEGLGKGFGCIHF
ncbi:hypothetical protein TL16_g09821 [Triparma laevis f. inornata]|uniref:Uncharacterized protein n=1 Tax=Triparma laevis f. inornata TaxID=1714386 RepID=A0A9W7B4W7_9STRA|nr:hypothetical protein TL16_g09821 [Triparma laevis f. inornata]